MMYKLIYRLKSISHSGAHVGRDVEIKISSLRGILFSAKKRIPAEKVTEINVEIGRTITEDEQFSLPLSITIIEHDTLFNDIGTTDHTISLRTDRERIITETIEVPVVERRLFFWKKRALFSVVIENEVYIIVPSKRIPTLDNPQWTGNFNDDTEIMLLARAIFGEARGELLSNQAREAVGWSIRNRVEFHNALRFGGTYHEVILKPKQYSAFISGDPNRPFVENPIFTGNAIDAHAWENCYQIAENILMNRAVDPTNGANHYFDDSIKAPTWAKQEYFKVKIDSLLFYETP